MIDIDRGDQENFEKKKLWPKSTRNPLRIRQNRMTPDESYIHMSRTLITGLQGLQGQQNVHGSYKTAINCMYHVCMMQSVSSSYQLCLWHYLLRVLLVRPPPLARAPYHFTDQLVTELAMTNLSYSA